MPVQWQTERASDGEREGECKGARGKANTTKQEKRVGKSSKAALPKEGREEKEWTGEQYM